MFDKLKENMHSFFARKKRKITANKVTKNQRKIQSVLVIIDNIDFKEFVFKELTDFFKENKATIQIEVFKKKSSKAERLDYITSSDFGWFGGVSDKINEFILTKKYDLLINYSKVDEVYLKTLLLHCDYDFSISYAHLDNELYDMQISCDVNDIQLFTSEVKKYLKILN
ncbi:MAG: hypothetical protein KGV44_06915 [Flavobacteriaceae bacterium]|nr:hypothetical protein [Flavobacteriaceae bacterium]